MKRLLAYLVALAKSGFYGTVTIPFRNGTIGKITIQQDFVMDTIPDISDVDRLNVSLNPRVPPMFEQLPKVTKR